MSNKIGQLERGCGTRKPGGLYLSLPTAAEGVPVWT